MPTFATRYDKRAANYLAFIKLASIRLWIRAYEPTPSRAAPRGGPMPVLMLKLHARISVLAGR
jgi:hypothetical protein